MERWRKAVALELGDHLRRSSIVPLPSIWDPLASPEGGEVHTQRQSVRPRSFGPLCQWRECRLASTSGPRVAFPPGLPMMARTLQASSSMKLPSLKWMCRSLHLKGQHFPDPCRERTLQASSSMKVSTHPASGAASSIKAKRCRWPSHIPSCRQNAQLDRPGLHSTQGVQHPRTGPLAQGPMSSAQRSPFVPRDDGDPVNRSCLVDPTPSHSSSPGLRPCVALQEQIFFWQL